MLVDLDDPALSRRAGTGCTKPDLPAPEYSTIYELHVRDFSISDATVPPQQRGTYLAFTDRGSAGMRHLRELAEAGLNTVHLLPVNDIATIEEDRARQLEPPCDLPRYPPDSEEQQACVTAVAARDGFNWGYDPLHYTAPEGSYAIDPDGHGAHRRIPRRWCRASTAPACGWSWTSCTTTRRRPVRIRSRSSIASFRATTNGSRRPARSRRPRAARTRRPSTP